MTSSSVNWRLRYQTWTVKNLFYHWYGWLSFGNWSLLLFFLLCWTISGLKLSRFLLLKRNRNLRFNSCLFYWAKILLVFKDFLFDKSFFTFKLTWLSFHSLSFTICFKRLLFLNHRRVDLLMLDSFLTVWLKNFS